jgi:hypothetical protein
MTTKLSLRALWKIYKHTSVARGFASSKRELALSHVAFYSRLRGLVASRAPYTVSSNRIHCLRQRKRATSGPLSLPLRPPKSEFR